MHDMESRESSNKKLLLAAAYGEIRSVEKYLADGTDVNCRDMHGWTPLHCAAQNGHKTTVFLLLSQGAVINSKAYNGSTPLHCAASGCGRPINGNMKYGTQWDYIAIVDCLISMGSVADIKEENNKTPYDLASNDEMRKRLKAAEEGIKAGLPIQLIHLDEKSVSDYKRLLKEDSYQLFELRLMIQGEQGTGKSTITRFLIDMHTPIFKNSAEDIGVYSGLSFFDDENNIWLGGQQDFTLEDILVSRAIQNMSKKQRLDTLPAEINVKEAQAPVQKPADNSKVVKNVGIIEKLKDFFGITKEVEEIKISVTVNGLYEKSRQVAKQKFFKRKIVPVTILDLKGDDFLFSTHQTFLTSRAVYMLVLDGSRTLNEPCLHEVFLPGRNRAAKTQRDYLRFCINNIMTYCKGEKSGFPKIIVILTHKDKLKDTEIEKRREEIFGEIDQMFDGTPIKQHLANEDKIFVNARNNNDPEMEKIKHSAILQAKLQPTWGERLPKCFLPLELEIQCLVKKGVPIITMEDIEKINDKQAVCDSDSAIKTFLKWQHSAGKILYFDEPYLDKYIIISPICLIDAFKSIITGKQFQKDKEESWYHMGKKGIILKQAVEALWQQKKYTHFFNSRTYLLEVMIHLDILVEQSCYDSLHRRIPSEYFYVASMVRKENTTGYLQSPTFSQRNIAISYYATNAFIPPCLSFRFITYCLSIWRVKTYGDGNEEMLFHMSAVLTIDRSLDVHIQCEEERIIVRLVHARSRALIMHDLASSVRQCLSAALHKLSHRYINTSSESTKYIRSFEEKICCSSSNYPCSIARKDVGHVWICPLHKIEHGKDLVLSWFTEKGKDKCESLCPVTDEIFLQQSPTDLHLRRLATVYDLDEVQHLVIALGLPSEMWEELSEVTLPKETIKFTAFERCLKMTCFTFQDLKKAAEEIHIQNLHTICMVLRDKHIRFDIETEKWDSTPTDEDIDKLAPLVGNNSLAFLVELGLTFQDWERIYYLQTECDLVKLNRKIMTAWMDNCKTNGIKPSLRTIGQAFGNIEINIQNIEMLLFSQLNH